MGYQVRKVFQKVKWGIYLFSKTFSKSELGYGEENFQKANWDI